MDDVVGNALTVTAKFMTAPAQPAALVSTTLTLPEFVATPQLTVMLLPVPPVACEPPVIVHT